MRMVKEDAMWHLWRVICAWQGVIDWCPTAQGIVDKHGKPDPEADEYAGIPTAWLRLWDNLEHCFGFSRASESYAMGCAYGYYLAWQQLSVPAQRIVRRLEHSGLTRWWLGNYRDMQPRGKQ